MGVDWRVRLDEAWRTIGFDVSIQGNLDPLVLFRPRKRNRASGEGYFAASWWQTWPHFQFRSRNSSQYPVARVNLRLIVFVGFQLLHSCERCLVSFSLSSFSLRVQEISYIVLFLILTSLHCR